MRSFQYLCFLMLVLVMPLLVDAQSKQLSPEYYTAISIPEELKKNANYVVRYDLMEIDAREPGKAKRRCQYVVTLLNEKAEHLARFLQAYDKMDILKDPEMKVYDAGGKLVKKYKRGDMYDRSYYDGGMTMISDDRILTISHPVVAYPITIETTYEQQLNKGYLDLGEFYFQGTESSVQEAVCIVRVAQGLNFRYKCHNIKADPAITTLEDSRVYTWSVKNMKAFKQEAGSQSWQYIPSVSLAIDNVVFGGIQADFKSWEGFGKWQKQLNEGLSELPPARVQELKNMVSGLTSDKEKAKLLYEYMQKNVRYVGIQLGIGGWKPFPATFVDQKKYGDCKALTNYMHSLLKAVGIPSYYAIVRAGENEISASQDFVNSPFNHVILCVPFQNDTTWLECTSNTSGFGKPGTFTENRTALLVTEDGGRLVNTPKSKMENNCFDSEVAVDLQADGSAKVLVNLNGSGEIRDNFIGVSYQKEDKQKERIMQLLNMKQPDLLELRFKDDADNVKKLEINLEFRKLNEFNAGSKLFFKPAILDLWNITLPVLEERKTSFFFSCPVVKKNKTVYKLPGSLEVESLPANESLTFAFGKYLAKYEYNADKNEIVIVSSFELNNHVIPASKYRETQQFMDDVAKSMSKKMVLRKKA